MYMFNILAISIYLYKLKIISRKIIILKVWCIVVKVDLVDSLREVKHVQTVDRLRITQSEHFQPLKLQCSFQTQLDELLNFRTEAN